MVATASDIQITASLIDDYLLTMDAPVGPNPNGRFVAVQDPTATAQWASLLAVDSSGDNLVLFTPDSSSHSGWSTATTSGVPVPSGASGEIARLAAFAQLGTTQALAYFPISTPIGNGNAATWMQWSAAGGWTAAALTGNAQNALGFTFQTDTYVDAAGNAYLYGVSGNISDGQGKHHTGAFFVVGYDPSGGDGTGAWDVLYEQLLDIFTPKITTGAAFRLLPGNDGGVNVVWIDQDIIYCQGATIAIDPTTSSPSFAMPGTPSSFASSLTGLTVSAIVPLPGSAGADNLLIVDGMGTLYMVLGYTQSIGAVSPLTGVDDSQPAGVVSASAGVDATGNLHVMVSETTTQMLWILRQSGSNGNTPSFDAWVPLGNTVSAIAAPAVMAGGPELFLVDPSLTAYHMTQNLTDLTWSTRAIAAPAASTATPTNIAGTSMNLTVVDANQVPIPKALISVSSDQPVVLLVAGVSYPIGPGTPPVQIQADPVGQACVLIETTTLSMPPLLFQVTNTDGSTAQRSCQGDQVELKQGETLPVPAHAPACVASRLAGQDPNWPLTASTLQNPTPPLLPLLNTTYPDPSGIVTSINNAGQWLLPQNVDTTTNTLSLANVAVKHWSIDFGRDGEAAKFQVLSEAEGFAARQHAQAQTAVGSIIGTIFGDVANFFKHAWQQLEKITVTIGTELTVIFNDALPLVVNTVREAGQALETIFSRIVQGVAGAAIDAYDAVKNAINWLKQLFEWDDILITQRVIRKAVTSGLTAAQGAIGTAESFVQAKFSTLQGDVTDFFTNLESYFEQTQTFNTMASGAGSSPLGGTGGALAGQPASTAYNQNGARSNYVHNHMKAYYSSTSSSSGGGSGTGSMQSVLSLIQSNVAGDTFNGHVHTLQTTLQAQVSDFRQFFDIVIVDLLKALNDLTNFALGAIEDIIIAILKLLSDAIDAMLGIWSNTTLDIPIISWLFTQITKTTDNPAGEPFTILNALSLVLAVPCTILYKVLISKGVAPFTEAEAVDIETNGLPWPQLASAPAMLAKRPQLTAAAVPTYMRTAGVIAGLANLLLMVTSTGADVLAFQPEEEEEEPLPDFKKYLSWGTLFCSATAQVLSAPFNLMNGLSGAADGWTLGVWLGSLFPFGCDLIATGATGGLMRFTDQYGPPIDTCFGAVMITVAAIALHEQGDDKAAYTGWDQANIIVPQIGRLFKFLIMTKDSAPTAAVALPTLVALDVLLGLGSTVTQLGAAIDG
ncbi:hypothetical protein [Bradyrhizobium prioriisuperbiae]|uniref:hypothetical protein n=1 Tax=Bradyrhizobium prioriisuperbiae TaxID=2854389 RepID=UPI0028EF4C3F|nr:hypothetical protein [Bradyrhizobium prioritasuperba]